MPSCPLVEPVLQTPGSNKRGSLVGTRLSAWARSVSSRCESSRRCAPEQYRRRWARKSSPLDSHLFEKGDVRQRREDRPLNEVGCKVDFTGRSVLELDEAHVIPHVPNASDFMHVLHAMILVQRPDFFERPAGPREVPILHQLRGVKVDPLPCQPQSRPRAQIALENVTSEIDL